MSPQDARFALAQMEREGRDWTILPEELGMVTRFEAERVLGLNEEDE